MKTRSSNYIVPLFIMLVFACSDNGSDGNSSDGGGSNNTDCPDMQISTLGDYISSSNLTFINPNEGWVTTQDTTLTNYIFNTTDNGKTWSRLGELPKEPMYQSLRFVNSKVGYFTGGLASHLYQTLDGGKTWTLFLEEQVYAYSSNSTTTAVLLMKDSKFLLKYISNDTNVFTSETVLIEHLFGRTMHIAESGDLRFGSVKRFKKKDDNGYNEYYENLFMAHLSNGTWTYSTLPSESEQLLITQRSMFFLNQDIGYYVDPGSANQQSKGALYKTSDGGKTWTMTIDLNLEKNKSLLFTYLSFIDENIGYASSNAALYQLYKTTDGGKNWTKVFDYTKWLIAPDSLAIPDSSNVFISATAHPCSPKGPMVAKLKL